MAKRTQKGSQVQARQPSRRCTRKIVLQDYQLLHKIGKGGYSYVYSGIPKVNPSISYAFKVNYSTASLKHTLSDLKYLLKFQHSERIPQLFDTFIKDGHVYIVQEYFSGVDFREFVRGATVEEMRHYLLELLLALREMKRKGVCHRDVKPENFLYDPKLKRGMLIDFGLASTQRACAKQTQICGTKGFYPPQVLFHNPYTFQSDMWPVGIIMLSLVTRKHNIFYSMEMGSLTNFKKYTASFLLEMAILFKQRVARKCYQEGYQITLPGNLRASQLRNLIRMQGFDKNAKDLLRRLLNLDPEERITVEQAINHDFFGPVRKFHRVIKKRAKSVQIVQKKTNKTRRIKKKAKR